MDKETLSNYGWIVICVLVLAVMIALATPFGNYISDAIWSTANGLFNTNNNALDNTLEDLGVVPTPEQLQAKYKFEYYSTLNGAVNDVNNGTIGENADANKEDAVAGIYTNAGQTYVVLLKDTTETTRVQPSVDMTINLGGNVLSFDATVGIDVISGNVSLYGHLPGSVVQITREGPVRPIQVQAEGILSLNGGTYIGNSQNGGNAANIFTFGNLTISDAKIISGGTGYVRAVETAASGITKIVNSEIVASSFDKNACGIFSSGSTTVDSCNLLVEATTGGEGIYIFSGGSITISNSDIKAYSNYTYSEGEGYYGAISVGISNNGTLTINDCYIMGTHSGVSNHGTLYVNGGTYEGYGHGGFYFSGTGITSYVRNATIRECPMPDGYTGTAGDNNAGFYIGGATGNDNITVYMDNCDIYGSSQPIVLRGSAGEQNNSLYISNSRINTDRNIRIDNDTHKLYIGTGNNFTANNTGRPSAVVTTNETYTQN